jgi:3-(3-hydroxy-phenyl)propionate hydroxylase
VFDAATFADDGTLAAWFETRGVRFVLVRPDAYVFGTAVADVGGLIRQAQETLHLHDMANAA